MCQVSLWLQGMGPCLPDSPPALPSASPDLQLITSCCWTPWNRCPESMLRKLWYGIRQDKCSSYILKTRKVDLLSSFLTLGWFPQEWVKATTQERSCVRSSREIKMLNAKALGRKNQESLSSQCGKEVRVKNMKVWVFLQKVAVANRNVLEEE